MPKLIPAKICKSVVFDCGCMATKHIKGDLEHLVGWAVIPCKIHTNDEGRKAAQEEAQIVWKESVNLETKELEVAKN